MGTVIVRAALLCLALAACGGPRPAPPVENASVAGPDAAVPDAPCPKQCMDTCCEADEVCQHGTGDDGTFAHCFRPRH